MNVENVCFVVNFYFPAHWSSTTPTDKKLCGSNDVSRLNKDVCVRSYFGNFPRLVSGITDNVTKIIKKSSNFLGHSLFFSQGTIVVFE